MLGESFFYSGARAFLDTYKRSNALSIDYFNILQQYAPSTLSYLNLTDVLWAWASQAGFPLITASPSATTPAGQRSWTLTQSQYNLSTSQQWPVWVEYVYQPSAGAAMYGSVWLNSTTGYTATVMVPDSVRYLKLNFNRTGFYRVQYPPSAYYEFQVELNNQLVPVGSWTHQDRISLLLDTYQMQLDGFLQSWPIALNATLFLQRERAYSVWVAGAYIINDLWSRLRFAVQEEARSDPVGQQNVMRFIQTLTNYSTSTLMWQQVNFSQHLEGMMQLTIAPLACKVRNSLCRQQAVAWYGMWNSSSMLPPANLRPIVFGYGGGLSSVPALLQAYRGAPNAVQANAFLNGAITAADNATLMGMLRQAQDDPTFLRAGDTVPMLLGRMNLHNDLGWSAALGVFAAEPGRLRNLTTTFDVDGPGMRARLNETIDVLVGSVQVQEDFIVATALMRSVVGSLSATAQGRFQEQIDKANSQIRWVGDNWTQIKNWMGAGFF